MGCGEGVLLRKFSSNHYNLYHGLDFSKVAIESCKKHANSKVELFNTNISNFETDNKFDCVIFCESLCYMKNIQQILNKFKFFLKSNGKIIISCFDELSTRQFWDHIPNEFNLISSTSVFNSKDMKWNIKLFDIPARDVT